MDSRSSDADRAELRWGAAWGGPGRDLGYTNAADALFDPRGWTVRCTPWRRTVCIANATSGAHEVFVKHRCGEQRFGRSTRASREWSALTRLAQLGLRTAEPVIYARIGRRSLIGTGAAAGRSMDVWWAVAAGDAGLRARLVEYARTSIIGDVARLHAAGWCYRDLYWNHVFVEVGRDGPHGTPTWIDVERAFMPRLRLRRWIVKDLAGLVASWPGDGLRCENLRTVLSAYPAFDRRLERAVWAKAARILAHRPRYG